MGDVRNATRSRRLLHVGSPPAARNRRPTTPRSPRWGSTARTFAASLGSSIRSPDARPEHHGNLVMGRPRVAHRQRGTRPAQRDDENPEPLPRLDVLTVTEIRYVGGPLNTVREAGGEGLRLWVERVADLIVDLMADSRDAPPRALQPPRRRDHSRHGEHGHRQRHERQDHRLPGRCPESRVAVASPSRAVSKPERS
jgi:hypothetical protein